MDVSTARTEEVFPIRRIGNLEVLYSAREVEVVDLWAEEGRREYFVTLDIWYADLVEREVRKWSSVRKEVVDAESEDVKTIEEMVEEIVEEFISWAEKDQMININE